MVADDEYELMPHKQIKELREELDRLKKNPLAGSASGKDLLTSVDQLNESIADMLKLFKTAADDLKLEERDEFFVAKKMKPLLDKLDTVIEQNKKIAQGIVAVADMLEGKTESKPMPPPVGVGPLGPPPPSFDSSFSDFDGPPPPPGMPLPRDIPPPPGMPPRDFGSMPPPPPPGKSLFDKFRK